MSPDLRAQDGSRASIFQAVSFQRPLATLLLLSLFACSESQEFVEFDAPDPDTVGPPRWRIRETVNEHLTDLSLIDESLVSGSANSYVDFVLRGDSERAMLVASLPYGSAKRVYGRMYTPRSNSGKGWEINPSLRLIDSAGSDPGAITFGNIALGISPGGDILSVFSDGVTYLRSALANAGQNWNDYRAIASTLKPINTSGTGGRSSDLLWDSAGRALWAYVTSDGTEQLKVRRFSYDSGWNSSSEEIHLGTEVDQVKLLDDGYNKLAVWRTSAVTTSASISAGTYFNCAIENEDLRCWGFNSTYQLASGNPSGQIFSAYPIAAQGIGAVAKVASGLDFACAIDRSGAVYCWGNNNYGQIGVVGPSSSSRPVRVTGLIGETATDLVAGDQHACVILGTGLTQCWGRNFEGQLGRGTTFPDWTATPSDVLAAVNQYSELTAGKYHTCGLTVAGNVECWGLNDQKQVGNGVTTCGGNPECPVPSTVINTTGVGLLSGVSQIASSEHHTCAVVGTNVACWGANGSGQLGRGNTTTPGNPGLVCAASGCGSDLSGISEVRTGGLHSCARAGTALRCWGSNSEGQLGDNQASGTSSTIPVTASPITASTNNGRFSLGYLHTCAIDSSKITRCWGNSTFGQIGDGASGPTANRLVPTSNQATLCNTTNCLLSANLDDPTRIRVKSVATYASSNSYVMNFGAATDAMGNTVVAFIQYNSSVAGCSGASCYRLYGGVRSVLGNWSAQVRIDTEYDASTTSLYQSGSYGPNFPLPAIVQVSPGKFLIVSSFINTEFNFSTIESFGYDSSTGWQYSPSDVTGVYTEGGTARFGNQMTLSTDKAGNALLISQYCVHDEGYCSYFAQTYSGGAWDPNTGIQVFGTPCDSTNIKCNFTLPPQAHLFPSGEKLAIFAAPKDAGGSKMRLQFLEYY